MIELTFNIYKQEDLNAKNQEQVAVYGILRDNKYIYIGKTKRGILFRLSQHRFLLSTDVIHTWTPMSNDKLGILESELILLFQPSYNIQYKRRKWGNSLTRPLIKHIIKNE